jgi:hypothetical protein
MVIAFLMGGLGNQMFQYATGLRLASVRGVELKIDLSNYWSGEEKRPEELKQFVRKVEIDKFRISAKPATVADIKKLGDILRSAKTIKSRIVRRVRRYKPDFMWPATHIREKGYRFDPAILDLPDNVYLSGFWQSEKYFADIADKVRAEFVPKDAEITRYATEYVNRLRSSAGPVVSLHVRRGDLARSQELKAIKPKLVHTEPVATEYFHKAIARIGADHQFLVFSDSAKDIEWCRQNIKASRLAFSEGHCRASSRRAGVCFSACRWDASGPNLAPSASGRRLGPSPNWRSCN